MNEHEKKRCGAKTRSGNPCKSWAMANGRCRMHGGKLPGGIAAGRFKDGRYSKYIPNRLMDRFETALLDPAMLEQRHEIALMEIRINDLLQQIGTGTVPDFYRKLAKLWNEFRTYAGNPKAKDKAQETLNELDVLIMGSVDEQAIWEQIEQAIETKRKITESERKRIIEAQEFVTLQEAMNLTHALVQSINKHIKDDRVKQLIQSDIRSIYNR